MKLEQLTSVLDFQGGSQPPKKDFESQPSKSNIRFLQIRDFKTDEKIVYIPISKKNRLCKKDDILIARYGASVGQILSGKEGAYNVALMKVIDKNELYKTRYLYYFFNSPYFQKNLLSRSERSAQAGFNKGDLSEIKIPVPSLQEQEKIVERLDKVFETIDSILRNNDLKKKLYSDYFESISWDEVIENQKFPKNPISDFFELDPSKSEISNENLDEVSFIPMADVDELVFEVDSKQIKDYKQVKKGYKYFANGDFILAKITPCFENGKMGQVNNLKNKIGFGSTEFIVHRSNGKILNEWLFLLYSNSIIRKKLASTMSGAVGHKRVSKETISNLQISSPTIEEQKKIIDKLFMIKKTIDKKISTIDQEIIKYSSLKKSIVRKEFSYE